MNRVINITSITIIILNSIKSLAQSTNDDDLDDLFDECDENTQNCTEPLNDDKIFDKDCSETIQGCHVDNLAAESSVGIIIGLTALGLIILLGLAYMSYFCYDKHKHRQGAIHDEEDVPL